MFARQACLFSKPCRMKTCEGFKPDMTVVVVNGMLVFGLTTACLFAMTQKVRPQKRII